MPYAIMIVPGATAELKDVKPYVRSQIIAAMKSQLVHRPRTETRNRKPLVEFRPDFEIVPPAWELRVGEYRVYYDINEAELAVYVRAIRRKPPHATTEEIT